MHLKNPVYEFHVARELRDFYDLDEALFAQTGNVVFLNFYAVRLFADRLNRKRDLISTPERAIKAGQLNAMGLIDEILHYIAKLYREQVNKNAFNESLLRLEKIIGKKKLSETLERFVDGFPPLEVYRSKTSSKNYLKDKTAGKENREITIEELLIFYLANRNPAFAPFHELFDDTQLGKESAYREVFSGLEKFFEEQPVFGPDNQTLIDMLQAPMRKHPNSLSAQLDYIRKHWGGVLSDFILRLFSSIDLIKEEEKAIFAGPGPAMAPDFSLLEDEPERFSTDLDWMPKVVMIAKSTYVWLDQLSKKYNRYISRLDQIPDEELDILAQRGFTGLWFIGLWERSQVSRKIKQMCGNPEAASSAYSLFDYQIAEDLGGDAAYQNLRDRAWQRRIRIASDMVPNHTGIYSKWVIEHPDWFIQTSHSLYPNYNFSGTNLSDDDRVGIYIEDGYWNRTDAAVQFKRVDHHTGEERYIYHGNDGTSMPWNDTAQLDYLKSEVREAVIQTILHVARKFPIIRLDAAMTLSKKHFQRLWYPQPGSGGDIPTRSEFALSHEQFNQLFPVEFWREVVDRVAAEVPDTLLLAEAFWMMEGYFVRSLGMHRVYNSAFMNMLKNEDNQKYRHAIKNVMEFNPEILKRYVNFMNNPDEETAVAQFGKDDKYFGVCIVMATMPGLPMFGHGQIEGFTEKYGMEYHRAYWDEHEDQQLISRHEREVFPLLKKRYLFSGAQNFVLYDFAAADGGVNENVFAYSNQAGAERALVIYNNKYDRAVGWVRYAAASASGAGRSMGDCLGLNREPGTFTVFRDMISGLEYIRNSTTLCDEGLYVELDGFRYHAFTDFREVRDNAYHHYQQLHQYLNGRGVPGIEEALKETFLVPMHRPFGELMHPEFIGRVLAKKQKAEKRKELGTQFQDKIESFLKEIVKYTANKYDVKRLSTVLFSKLQSLQKIETQYKKFDPNITEKVSGFVPSSRILYCWLVLHRIGSLQDENFAPLISLAWMDEFLLSKILFNLGYSDHELMLIKSLVLHPRWMDRAVDEPAASFEALMRTDESRRFLQLNRYQDHLYINRESWEQLIFNFLATAILSVSKEIKQPGRQIKRWLARAADLLSMAEKAGYDTDKIQQLIVAADTTTDQE